MQNPTTVTINGTEYIPKEEKTGNIRIVILQRGWVKVGRFYQDGVNCRLEHCATIRNWGTEKGLGQIATTGPTTKTVLDLEPTCRFHELTVISMIDCEESKWANKLS